MPRMFFGSLDRSGRHGALQGVVEDHIQVVALAREHGIRDQQADAQIGIAAAQHGAFANHLLAVEARRAAAMAAALLLIARQLRSHSQDAALAAQASLAGLAPMAIALPEISAALRAAALMPISDDGAARIAAGVVAETFWNALRAAWPAAPGA